MKKTKYSRFFSDETEKMVTFAEYITQVEKKKNEILFSIAEATQGMNMKKIEEWTIFDIENFLEYKKQQEKQLKTKKYE